MLTCVGDRFPVIEANTKRPAFVGLEGQRQRLRDEDAIGHDRDPVSLRRVLPAAARTCT